ncbi:hypothetical protein BDV26DRAFT_264578 [Aspergillus bertholletiae]|uniref:Protein kinase domain-containing protein n=1 Tax=Aspergillus bertholletiae TaxID=1226010 RepID=A0A5N7B631_9EURO|nr:hypothetical protein BDV26DRAFT_264578 [Aspergillus bertholletiae]
MDPASLALAVVGTLDLCVTYGKKLINLCREQRNLESDLAEIILAIEGSLLKTETQLASLRALWDTIPSTLQEHYGDALTILQLRITGAFENVQYTVKFIHNATHLHQKVRAVYLKRRLNRVVTDLDDWKRRFDPSWYLITRVASSDIDAALNSKSPKDPSTMRLARMREAVNQAKSNGAPHQNSIFVSDALFKRERAPIAGTSRTSITSYRHGTQLVLLDRTDYTAKMPRVMGKTNVCDLAKLLLHVEPATFSLLKCEGVIEVPGETGTQFDFVFNIPKGLSSPHTLRSLLLEGSRCSLSKRFQLAKQLARSVMFVHATNFVHKNIRPDTVVVFADETGSIGPSFLIGFERIRKADGPTESVGDLEWEKNLYRHPVRQGLVPEEFFLMQHDIYSLGVCLLEVALWHSFVQINGGVSVPSSELPISDALEDKDRRRGAFAIKRQLVAIAKDQLPQLVGDTYTALVTACLCCLDKSDDNTLGDQRDLMDANGIGIGVRYIENILGKIEDLCA